MSGENEFREETEEIIIDEENVGEENAGEDAESLDSVNPDLLDFFDAMDHKSYDGMFEALRRLSESAAQKELDDIYTVLDMEPAGGDIKEQTAAVAGQLKTLRKFDGERLR